MLLLALLCSQAMAIPVVNGTPTSSYPAVGALMVRSGDYLYAPFCTGTLVNQSWVLTAAHCVDAIQSDYKNFDIYFSTGGKVLEEISSTAMVQESYMHPEYDSVELTSDIGLLKLEGMLATTQIMAVNKDPLLRESWLDTELRYVGYGVTEDGAVETGIKRYADIPIFEIDEIFVYGYDPIDGQNVCSGDSGGAALDISGSRPELVGVNSFVSGWDTTYPCEEGFNGATRVDVYLPWIEQYVEVYSASELAVEERDGFCSYVPVGQAGSLALIFSLLGVYRRRQA